jgi:glycosyltransferase involved in cell wall biosynthesis
VVGDGPARPEVEALLGALGNDRVAFAGLVAETALPAVYAAADLFVWPAVREAYGLAMLEAQAAGLAVVAGREGGVPEVVADGRTGVLAPPRDPAALAAAVRDLLERPARRRALAAAAMSFVATERSIEQASAVLSAALAAAPAIRAMRR